MSTNAGPEYFTAEKRYLAAQTLEQKMFYLEEMIKFAPKHKGSENMVAELKKRLNKLKDKKEKSKKTGKTTQKTIKKEGFQVVLLGFPNVGKSSLLSKLTNAHPLISSIPFTTSSAEVGTLFHQGIKAQIVDLPAIGSERFDIGLVNTADLILIIVNDLSQINQITPLLSRASGEKITLFNKTDLLSEEELRKLEEKIKSKRLNTLPISTITNQNLEELKERIIKSMKVIRIYTKEPRKPTSSLPMILKENSTVKNAAENILKGFSQRVKETRVTGPSSKFPNQKVGLSHVLKDKDIVEFHAN
jgi:small GTP-binding protein